MDKPSLLNRIKIFFKKRSLSRIYLKWREEIGDYSCGYNLSNEINPRIRKFEDEMNKIAKELRGLGDNVPELPFETNKDI